MGLNHMKGFTALTKTENYLETAENLFISQPSLSKHIRSLEVEPGAALFDRTTRQVRLNEVGKVFLRYTQQLIDTQHQCNTVFVNLKEAGEQSLTIGLTPIMAPYGIIGTPTDFKKANVKINLSTIEDEIEQLEQKLRNDDCDSIFIRRLSGQKEVTEDLDNFVAISFITDYLAAVLLNDHLLISQTLIDLSELKSEGFLFLPPHSIMHSISLQTCRQAGLMPSIAYTGERAENTVDLVSKGVGISLLMTKPISYISTRNLVRLVPIFPHIETEIATYYKKSILSSKAANHFLGFVRRQRGGLFIPLLLETIHFRNRLL